MKCRHCNTPWELDGWEYCPHCSRNYGGAEYPATQTDEELRDIARLIQQIHTAFAGVKLGGGMTIHQAHLEGICDRGDRWFAAGKKDPESEWSEVPDWKLESGASTLSFFDVEGWRFYLPAFLCWSLQNWRTTYSTTADRVVSTLFFDDFSAKRHESLNQDQSKAVYAFLEFLNNYSDEFEAARAIESYWYQFRIN